jgi:hypothetical protein
MEICRRTPVPFLQALAGRWRDPRLVGATFSLAEVF